HRSELPKIVNCAEMVGITKCFGVEAPLTALITDQQAALFGQGCTQPGDAKCTYGTGAFFLATTGPQIQHSESQLVSCIAWQLDDVPTYCLDGQIYTAAAAISWLERIGLLSSAEDLD